mmetsp:Transcript_4775/g.7423  ORF Transcript_4775/g.7423 Transcript_4775/m.7423 type:complete len:573 (-) Transcript_4775:324-2042(-)|eukprot:CAMPEP_0184655302 /NCGR_PEP_ID=MMETSP0308-20130426/12914_1 /TAXON_ID=38269 /ORGANISM="Gloeochaete witrockiana, Strain SAG 46.84" /LENGTH=572 /DNA_ID=CAMNT_0027091693 /DNA_START=71 /DNA_END=1789 /DNA_ORIENTATION=-
MNTFEPKQRERVDLDLSKLQQTMKERSDSPRITDSPRWDNLVSQAQKQHFYSIDAKPGTITFRDRWKRAERDTAVLGGGYSAKQKKALLLRIDHWLEVTDSKHRYGSCLRPYFDVWNQSDSEQNFFYWLDYGQGKSLSLSESPREALEKNLVHYCTPDERDDCEVFVENGLLKFKQSKKLLHTLLQTTDIDNDDELQQLSARPNIVQQTDAKQATSQEVAKCETVTGKVQESETLQVEAMRQTLVQQVEESQAVTALIVVQAATNQAPLEQLQSPGQTTSLQEVGKCQTVTAKVQHTEVIRVEAVHHVVKSQAEIAETKQASVSGPQSSDHKAPDHHAAVAQLTEANQGAVQQPSLHLASTDKIEESHSVTAAAQVLVAGPHNGRQTSIGRVEERQTGSTQQTVVIQGAEEKQVGVTQVVVSAHDTPSRKEAGHQADTAAAVHDTISPQQALLEPSAKQNTSPQAPAEHLDDAAKKILRNKNKYIYVLSCDDKMYVHKKVKGRFHHTSFLGGATVQAAGGLQADHGQLIKITPMSGHYQPLEIHFGEVCKWLKSRGVDFEKVKAVLDKEDDV